MDHKSLIYNVLARAEVARMSGEGNHHLDAIERCALQARDHVDIEARRCRIDAAHSLSASLGQLHTLSEWDDSTQDRVLSVLQDIVVVLVNCEGVESHVTLLSRRIDRLAQQLNLDPKHPGAPDAEPPRNCSA